MAKDKKDKKTEAIKKASDIEEIKNAINKKYGKGTLLYANEAATSLEIDRVPFGIYDLDLKIGGGVPRGRITMLKGRESCGKTTLALKAAGNFQRCDRRTGKPYVKFIGGEWVPVDFGRSGDPDPMRVVWLDFEHDWEDSWSTRWGVNVDDVLLSQPEYAEQGLDIADYCIRSKLCDLLVVDSVAAVTPGIEIEKSHEEWQIGVMARLIGKALRKWTSGMNTGGLLSEIKCSVILINQMRMAMSQGVSYWTTPGGNALGHFKSIDINLKKKDIILDPIADRPVASVVDFVIDKNKTAATQGTGQFQLFFNNSEALNKTVGCTDEEAQIIRLAAYWKILKSSKGGRYEVNGVKLHGIESVVEVFQEDTDLVDSVKEQIEEYEREWTDLGKGPPQLKAKEEGVSEDG